MLALLMLALVLMLALALALVLALALALVLQRGADKAGPVLVLAALGRQARGQRRGPGAAQGLELRAFAAAQLPALSLSLQALSLPQALSLSLSLALSLQRGEAGRQQCLGRHACSSIASIASSSASASA